MTTTRATKRDIDHAAAVVYLADLLERGDTLWLVSRGRTLRANQIVDVRWPAADGDSIATYLAPLIDRPYIFKRQGLLLRGTDSAATLAAQVSTALFGEPGQLSAVWV